MIDVCSDNYRCRPKKTLIVNTTWGVKVLWTFAKAFLHAQTKAKMMLSSDNCPEEMTQLFHLDQLEEKFGGNQPNVVEYWPPKFPSGEIGYDKKHVITKE